ncbi:MAG: right-handed parallel beta-helix repeat-containing protein, partial [Xanthomonadales bacterium]|nr:right-handed parallel beta-helix repeat-containing protein [Xanthomonadales bacterium]
AWYRGDGQQGHGASNVLLENLRIHDTGRDGIKITPKCDHVTIRRSEIWNTGAADAPGTPLEQRNAEGIDNVGGSFMLVEDSHVHDTATTGIYFKGGASDVIIQRNRIENAGMSGILIGFDTSEEFFDLEANPEYYEALRGVVRNNLIRNTGYAGIGLYAARDAVVVNNTIIDAA